MRGQRRTDIERKVKWRDIVDPVYATGYQREMLNAGSIIIKEMNSLVIGRLFLIGPCLHKYKQGAVQCSSPYNHYRSGSSGIRIRFTEGFIFKTSATTGDYYWRACQSQGQTQDVAYPQSEHFGAGLFSVNIDNRRRMLQAVFAFRHCSGSFSANIDDPANLRHLQTRM